MVRSYRPKLKLFARRLTGRLAERFFPSLAREVDENRNRSHWPRIKAAIVHYRSYRASLRQDSAAVEAALASYWREKAGDRFHAGFIDHRFELFLGSHAGILDGLRTALTGHEAGFHRLVEMGCGDGKVLAHASEHLPFIRECVGLDLNASVIERARSELAGRPRLSFVAADARKWLDENPVPGTVFLTNGGVLEYLSRPSVDKLFRGLHACGPAAIALVEPLAPEHDLSDEPDSLIFGRENSFSHNYPARLAAAGFEVVHNVGMDLKSARWILIIGLTAEMSSVNSNRH